MNTPALRGAAILAFFGIAMMVGVLHPVAWVTGVLFLLAGIIIGVYAYERTPQ